MPDGICDIKLKMIKIRELPIDIVRTVLPIDIARTVLPINYQLTSHVQYYQLITN